MFDVAPHTFDLGRLEDGRWAAASCKSPYFYFEGESREEVIDDARQAIDFYKQIEGRVEVVSPTETATITRARRTETVRMDDLEAA